MIVIFNLGVEDKNFYYLSGIKEKCRGVLILGDSPKVLASPLEAGIAEKYVETEVLEGSLWNALKKELKGKDLSLNFPKVSLSLYNKLKKLGIGKIKDVSKELSKKRALKTAEEVKKIRRASEVASKSLVKLRDFLRPGLSELEVKAELEHLALKNGAEGFSFDTIVASGPNSAIPHAVPTRRVIKEGDAVLIDFGPTYELYTSDISRTFVLGKSKEFSRIYEKVLSGQLAAIDALEGGVSGEHITKAAEKHTGKLIHSLGHGLGLDTHESPGFSGNLMNSMVFTIEPGVYKGLGVRIEDVVWLDGLPELLTGAPKTLDFAII